LRSIVSVLSCVTDCWFCCSVLTATIINEYYLFIYLTYIISRTVFQFFAPSKLNA